MNIFGGREREGQIKEREKEKNMFVGGGSATTWHNTASTKR